VHHKAAFDAGGSTYSNFSSVVLGFARASEEVLGLQHYLKAFGFALWSVLSSHNHSGWASFIMVIFIRTVALLVLLPHLSRASQSCPLLGPDFPAPRNLSGNAAVQDALANLTEVLDAKGAPHSPLEEIWLPAYTSFSVELFSAHDPKSLFQYHHSAGSLVNSTSGVKKVDSNSIYRIGSISKLFTVYTFLIESGDVKFNEPVTKYVPELKAAAKKYNARQDPVNYVDWEAITIGALASQTADIGRDCEFSIVHLDYT
jgi:hypothetical protein